MQHHCLLSQWRGPQRGSINQQELFFYAELAHVASPPISHSGQLCRWLVELG